MPPTPEGGAIRKIQKLDGVCAVCAARAVSSLLAISPPDAQPSVPGFVLHEQIGRGAMGVVYRAHRIADERTAAVKLLPEALLNDADIVDRFAREAHALAALDHRNILRVLDSGVTEQGQFFLATELAEGGDLAARLRLGPLPVSEVARIFREVLAAVGAAHERGIVHRDIKPANILLAADGAVLVGDFSIAKLLPEHAADSVTLTASGDSFGTPYYIAPEVRRGAPDVSEKADLFSLGVLLHELLTGRLPMGNYEPASQLAAVPRSVDAVIAHCLREAPGKRPASASALAREFDAALRPFPMWKKVALLTIDAVLAAGIATAWKKRSPAVAPQLSPTVASAKAPWRNSLGMQFVPVPGTRVLFSKWETRRADFGAFVSASLRPPAGRENEWKEPGFPTTPTASTSTGAVPRAIG